MKGGGDGVTRVLGRTGGRAEEAGSFFRPCPFHNATALGGLPPTFLRFLRIALGATCCAKVYLELDVNFSQFDVLSHSAIC